MGRNTLKKSSSRINQNTQKEQTNIFEIIEDRLIPDKEAKQMRGEVFTPINLVNEMLFGLRKSAIKKLEGDMPDIKSKEYYKFIWGLDEEGNIFDDDEDDRLGGIPLKLFRDSNTRWLDPANGIGNFPVVAFYMLDYQLNKHGNNEGLKGDSHTKKRRKHIVEKMLFMVELNKGNTNTARKIFNLIVPDATPNILCADTLKVTDARLLTLLGENRFDVIMGNPPYNSGGVKSSGVHDESNHESIWPHFITQTTHPFPGSLQLLKPEGYLCFIHPSSWLQENDRGKVNALLLSYHMPFLRIYTNFQSGVLFSGGGLIRTAYYVLQNIHYKPEHEIILLDTENKLETLHRKNFTESFSIYSSNNILIRKTFRKLKAIGDIPGYLKSGGKINGDIPNGQYPNIKTHLQDGIHVCKTNAKFHDLEKAKIIIKSSANFYYYDDYTTHEDSGEYGVYGNRGYYILDSIENLKRISKFLNTNLVKIILKATKHSQDNFDPNYIPDIRDYTGEISDKALCDFLKLDYDHVKEYKFIPNKQNIAKESDGCNSKTKKNNTATKKPKANKNTTQKRKSNNNSL